MNVLIGPRSGPVALAELSRAGVKRVSLGAALYRVALGALAAAGQRLAAGEMSAMGAALPSAGIAALLP